MQLIFSTTDIFYILMNNGKQVQNPIMAYNSIFS